MPDKLQKLQELLKIANEGLTRKEFTYAFKEVLKVVKDIKDTNSAEWKMIHEAMQKIPDRMMSEMMSSMSKTEKKMVKDTMDRCEKMCSEMDKEHKVEMAKIQLDMQMLKADREAIIEDALARVPEDTEETPEDIAKKLNGKELLSIDAIDGLEEKLEEVAKIKGQVQYVPSGVSGGGVVKAYDLSAQLNGVLKTFSLPAFWRVISVHLSSVPNILRPTIDYTIDANAMTLTFTDQIDALSTLNTGQTCIIVYAEP